MTSDSELSPSARSAPEDRAAARPSRFDSIFQRPAAARFETGATWAAAAAFPSMALSISLTQICVTLAFVLFAVAVGLETRGTVSLLTCVRRAHAGLPALWLVGLALFTWLILSGLGHVLLEPTDRLAVFQRAVRNEWSDLPLFGFGLLVFCLARRPAHRRILQIGLTVAVAAIVLTGVAAIFSEFRLSRLIKGGEMIASAANRPQHIYGVFYDVTLYRPIGFMNTRLTYAGLLILALPWAAVRMLQEPDGRKRTLWGLLLLLGTAVLWINGTRSALVGYGVTLSCLAVFFARRIFGMRPRLMLAFGVLSVIGLAGVYGLSDCVRRGVDRRLANAERHTDFARPILWTVAGALTLEHPLAGVGAGNFERAGLAWRTEYVRRHPETLYFFRNTPRGHAHNDLLHLSAVGGFPAAALFLALIFLCGRLVFSPADSRPESLTSGGLAAAGTLAFFVAGVAQCYFQDDEVAILFWSLLGLVTAGGAPGPIDLPAADQRSEN